MGVGCRWDVRSEVRSRGSGGVAVLFREELQPLIRRDDQARYMWVKIKADSTGRPFYIAICYFPLSISHYTTPKGQSTFMILDEDMWEFSRNGEVILLGDFKAKTGHSQTVFYDTSEEMLREVDTNDLDLARHSQDEECTGYGRYLLDMGTTHGLAILNGL